MRVLVCGGRDFTDKESAFAILDAYHSTIPITQIIEGGALGADRIGRDWAVANGVPHQTFPADWERYGRSAGPVRNQQMLDEGKPDFVLAFPGGKGTANMVKLSKAAKIPTFEYKLEYNLRDKLGNKDEDQHQDQGRSEG